MESRDILSVLVLTFNSSSTIIETLESILNQSYGSKNIRLVISDDASLDNTVLIVEKWLHENINEFNSVYFNSSFENKGIPGNLNSGLFHCNTQWVKLIAGDDLLAKGCLDVNMAHVGDNPESKIIFSKLKSFNSKGIISESLPLGKDTFFFNLTSKEQYEHLLVKNFSCLAPTVFFQKSLIDHIGGAEEKYPLIEDLPLWIKVTELGVTLDFLDEVTVYYRREDTVMHSNVMFVNRKFLKCRQYMQSDFINTRLKGRWIYKLDKNFYFKSLLITSYLTKNKKNTFSKIIINFFNLFRPYFYLEKLR